MHCFPPACSARSAAATRRGAFTLVELLLVLALLATVIAVAMPSLGRFFRGRSLDVEAGRFVALTRYGQSRAVSEGVPMVLWVDVDAGTYGLEAEMTFVEDDPKAVQFDVSDDVVMETEVAQLRSQNLAPRSTTEVAGSLPALRFTPDGAIAETSPEFVFFRPAREDEDTGTGLYVGLSRNRLNYEMSTNPPPRLALR